MTEITFGDEYHPEFEGYVWEKDGGIYISLIESKDKGKGNFSKYLQELQEKYEFIRVPTPFALMRQICMRKGFTETFEWFEEVGEECEILEWRRT